jgi:chemotaxis protein MotB
MALCVPVALGLWPIGCCEQQELKIKELQESCNQLEMKNAGLEQELAKAQQPDQTLLAQLDAQRTELASKDQTIADLRAELAGRPAGQDGWQRGTVGDRVTVGSDLLFASGKAELTAAGKQKLDEIARALTQRYANLPVRVYGYTDNDPIRRSRELWEDNLDLSANRAMAVTRYLCGKGVDAERVETIGMGATHFVASNDTPQAKAKNRRVEIYVVKQGAGGQG